MGYSPRITLNQPGNADRSTCVRLRLAALLAAVVGVSILLAPATALAQTTPTPTPRRARTARAEPDRRGPEHHRHAQGPQRWQGRAGSRFPASPSRSEDSKDGEELGTQTTDQPGPRQHRDPRATARHVVDARSQDAPRGRQAQRQGRDRPRPSRKLASSQLRRSSRSARSSSRPLARQQAHRRHTVRPQGRPDHRPRGARACR